MMDGHRPAVWISDRYTAQQGHAAAHQTCLAHLARDVAYAVETSDDPVPWRLQLWLRSVFALAERVTDLATSTLAATRSTSKLNVTASMVRNPGCSVRVPNIVLDVCLASKPARGCQVRDGKLVRLSPPLTLITARQVRPCWLGCGRPTIRMAVPSSGRFHLAIT